MSRAPILTANFGTGGLHGRCRVRRSSRINSAFVTGFGATALSGTVHRGQFRRRHEDPGQVVLVYPTDELFPVANLTTQKETSEPRYNGKKSAIRSQHHTKTKQDFAFANIGHFAKSLLPLLTNFRDEIVAMRRILIEPRFPAFP